MNTGGVLSHSYNGRVISNIKINGIDGGEFLINSYVAGFYNVPVIMVSGDNVLSQEAKAIIPNIETAIVKYSRGRNAAQCLPPEVAHRKIKEHIKNAVCKLNLINSTKLVEPCQLEVTFINSGMGELVSILPGTQLLAPNIITYQAKTIIEAYRVLMCMTLISNNIV